MRGARGSRPAAESARWPCSASWIEKVSRRNGRMRQPPSSPRGPTRSSSWNVPPATLPQTARQSAPSASGTRRRPASPVCSRRSRALSPLRQPAPDPPDAHGLQQESPEIPKRKGPPRRSAHQEQTLLPLGEEVVPVRVEVGRVLLHHEDLLPAPLRDGAPGVQLDREVRARAERARRGPSAAAARMSMLGPSACPWNPRGCE